jgi:hypothetical protein
MASRRHQTFSRAAYWASSRRLLKVATRRYLAMNRTLPLCPVPYRVESVVLLHHCAMKLMAFMIEFFGDVGVVHSYSVRAADELEALAMARADFDRIRRLYGSTNYRVLNPRSLIYRSP